MAVLGDRVHAPGERDSVRWHGDTNACTSRLNSDDCGYRSNHLGKHANGSWFDRERWHNHDGARDIQCRGTRRALSHWSCALDYWRRFHAWHA
jgi:hypothetical protein